MRVFITGSSGFVGLRCVARLREAGHTPLGTETEHDVTRRADLVRALSEARPDAIVHLAALSSVADSLKNPIGCYRVNFLGTANLLSAVRECAPRARVLLVGSGDQYGPAAADARPYIETDPLCPRNPYARSKAAAEWLGTLAADEGLDVVRIRPFNHTGPGQTDRFVASSFARQVAEIALGQRAPQMRVGNLDSMRDFLDVADVLDAYLALLDPAVPAAIYNIAGGERTSARQVLDTLFELAGVQAEVEVEVDPERWRPTDMLVGDASRLEKAAGWRPRTPLRATLSAMLDDWTERLKGEAASATAAP